MFCKEAIRMSAKKTLDKFIKKNPLTVMTRCIMGAVIGSEFDELFADNRCQQYDSEIKFSTLGLAIGEIALGTLENRNQAYLKYQEDLNVSSQAFYGKVNRSEPTISEAAVRHSAQQASQMMGHLDFVPWEVLPGYNCVSLDGNHMGKTEKRLKETRGLCAAPLPGTVVALFNHQSCLFENAYLLEDGHAQELTVLDQVVEDIQPIDLVMADRHFCITNFLLRIAAASGFFVIRQHGRLKGELLGKRQKIGRTETGEVFEQSLKIQDRDRILVVRRITVCLDEATRDGDEELHLLSNVPATDASALELAQLYRRRWEIENAFHTLTMTLNCEMKSNCYPRAALLQFCMALVAYNCRQVLLAALFAEHDQENVEQLSQYHVSKQITRPMEGMLTAIDEADWAELTPSTKPAIANFLRDVSRHVPVKKYRKTVRGPKKPKPKRKRCKAGTHVSTAKLLAKRKTTC
jgi:hypothetical protein